MFGPGRLHTPARVLAVLLLQAGQTEAGGEEDDDEDPHDEMTVVVPCLELEHVLGLLSPHTAPGATNY